jgi:lysine 2,3-aminomutase
MAIHQIKDVKHLEELTGYQIPDNEKEAISKIIEKMPVRLTDHIIELCKKSPALIKQYMPDIEEIAINGHEKPWVGIMDTGLHGVERMYIDRCIIMPINQCFSYCRFCFRKFYDKRIQRSMSRQEIDKAIEYVKNDNRLKGVLITGGDPFLDPRKLEYIIKNLRKIDHVQDIRIGTRMLTANPEQLSNSLVRMLRKYHNFKNYKPIEVAVHFNHPDELTDATQKAIIKLTNSSIRVYNQTCLLKGVNDNPIILEELFRKLRLLGVELYYMFHCMPVQGVDHLRTSIEKGLEIKRYFRGGNATGRINPTFVVATKIGKVEIGVDGYTEKRDGRHLWIKTPYKVETYKSINPEFELPKDICRINDDGYISIKYEDGID